MYGFTLDWNFLILGFLKSHLIWRPYITLWLFLEMGRYVAKTLALGFFPTEKSRSSIKILSSSLLSPSTLTMLTRLILLIMVEVRLGEEKKVLPALLGFPSPELTKRLITSWNVRLRTQMQRFKDFRMAKHRWVLAGLVVLLRLQAKPSAW